MAVGVVERGLRVHGSAAGRGGISASLRAIERKLSYVTLKQDEFGGTVAKYPRQKLGLTSPVEFSLHGKWKKLEIKKKELLALWQRLHPRARLQVHTLEKVDTIQREPDGGLTIHTARARYPA